MIVEPRFVGPVGYTGAVDVLTCPGCNGWRLNRECGLQCSLCRGAGMICRPPRQERPKAPARVRPALFGTESCTVCGLNWVDAADGFDTCSVCMRELRGTVGPL